MFNYNNQCYSQLKWFEVAIDVVLTHGWRFQLECRFQLILVDYHGFQLQIIFSNEVCYFQLKNIVENKLEM
jgi:hypothetical protein